MTKLTLSSLLIFLALAAPAPAADAAKTNLTPDGALEELKNGNSRFVSGKSAHCWQAEDVRKELALGQSPNAIILSCSDSRVPPELVFDQGLGALFTVRIAGNILTPETLASIEYAIKELGTRLIVVLGHESCGAVKAAVTTSKGADAGSKSLNELVSEIQQNIGVSSASSTSSSSTDKNDKKLRLPAIRNISAVAEALSKRSPIVRAAIDSGKMKVVKGIYSLETQKVDFLNQ